MTREELRELRDREQAIVADRKQLGDYDTNARALREAHETLLKLTQHLLDRMPRR